VQVTERKRLPLGCAAELLSYETTQHRGAHGMAVNYCGRTGMPNLRMR
jgi:hypothetical protein